MNATNDRPPSTLSDTVEPASPVPRDWGRLAVLMLGYVGIYLCRKNFAVANPLIGEAFRLNKAQIGAVASYSTAAYMAGKFVFGPIIDRVGGRLTFLMSLAAVALFGAAGGLSGSLLTLTLFYSLNRLAGSAGWGAMVKQVPDWFSARSMSLAMGVLSLSFVFGGVLATILAGFIARWSHNDWRWVMSAPSIVLAVILLVCWAVLPRGRPRAVAQRRTLGEALRVDWRGVVAVAAARRFWIVCALSFTLTLMRETFNTWTVDFFKTAAPALSSDMAAFLSTPFDACGAIGIVTLGWLFGRVGQRTRMSVLFVLLSFLAAAIALLPAVASRSVALATFTVGAIGFLAYGPYSLLAGVFAVEIKGKEHVATVAGILDGVGYFAAILSGAAFGRMLDRGGYQLGFDSLAFLAGVSAVLCLFLYERSASTKHILENETVWTPAT
jgi:sugar phosphate permease